MTQEGIKKAFGYLRFDEGKRGKQPSLEVQEAAIKEYCREHWIELVKIYEETEEADKDVQKRGVLRTMRKRVQKGEVDLVVVYSFDRLSESPVDAKYLTDVLMEGGGDFIALEDQINTTTQFGRQVFEMVLRFCEKERSYVQERKLDRKTEQVRAGKKPSSLNYGYERNDKGVLVPKSGEEDVVRSIFELYGRHQSIQKVCTILNEEMKVTSRRGNKWSPKSIYNILTNEVYIGTVKWRDEISEDQHEPLVSRETFEKVNELLSMNRRGGWSSRGRGRRGRRDRQAMEEEE
jgi:site-specific DNA recombinase